MTIFALWLAMQVASTAGSAATAQVSATACPVWEREHGFAASVRAHDLTAFSDHLDADAVFDVGGKSPLRGRHLITERWAGIVRGETLRLDWYPDRVIAAATGDLAWSSGPALSEMPDGKGGWTPMLSRFTSVWRLNADGKWRVVFDNGSQPVPATAEQVQAFRAGRTPGCDAD